MKKLFTILMICLTVRAQAQTNKMYVDFWLEYHPLVVTNWYASTTAPGSTNVGTFANPFTSLSSVSSHQGSFNPGDSVLFKGNDNFPGTWSISRSGTIGNPIVIGRYGTGLPTFTGNGTSRISELFYINNRSYLTFDHLLLYDPTLAGDVGRDSLSHIEIGWNFDGTSNHNTVQYCKGVLIGDGVLENSGGYQAINYNEWYNMRMVVNTPGGSDDFGATPLTIATKHNNFIGNYSHGCWAKSLDFTYDGGVVEFSHSGGKVTDSNFVAYNRSDSCDGFIETDGDGNDNTIVFNVNTNCGFLCDFHSGSTNTGWVFYNNTLIETAPSITGNSSLLHGSIVGVTFAGNVCYLRAGIDVAPSGTGITHTHNRYNVGSGSAVNFSLSTGEVSSTSAMFANTVSANPLNWDIHPLDNTVLASGVPGGTGYNVDFFGTVGTSNYIGAAKFLDVAPPGSRRLLWRRG